MASRSFRRVLGETHIERKCRLLFGACLLVLMAGTFTWVYLIAKNLVIGATRSQSRELVVSWLLKEHWQFWVTTNDKQTKELVDAVAEDFKPTTQYRCEILTLGDRPTFLNVNARRPTDERELALLRALDRELRDQAKLQADAKAEPEGEPGAAADLKAPALAAGHSAMSLATPRQLYKELNLPDDKIYVYYQPLTWSGSCGHCHQAVTAGAEAAALAEGASASEAPLHVVKVTLPDTETQNSIHKARAILLAAAIVTIFVAMAILYLIVRYVIVNPLKHLRDVSEQVREGKVQQRAEIHTNDEFEDLADSFNRMLRHLFDTQSDQARLNGELEGKMDELARMNVQLHEMNRVKSEFLANMSHELRTPLNSILGFSDVLQGIDALSDKQKRYVQNIQSSGRALLDMINDILDLAKLESNEMQVRPTEFRIEAVTQAQCDMIRALTEKKNIDLALDVQGDLPPLYQDQGKIQQILNNLLSNAVKFTPEGGRISVLVRGTPDERIELVVRDTGVGIADQDRAIIFEKFRQGSVQLGRDNLTREYSGTGLGLSIVKELCKLLGGEVSLESELGKGSAFTVVLPYNLNKPVPAAASSLADTAAPVLSSAVSS